MLAQSLTGSLKIELALTPHWFDLTGATELAEATAASRRTATRTFIVS